MIRAHSIALALAVVAAGCAKNSEPTEMTIDAGHAMTASPSAAMASASASPVLPASAAVKETEDQPPTEHRAERKAAAEVTRSNYKAELTKLEKELGGP